MEKEKEYERICKKLGLIPSEFKAPDFETKMIHGRVRLKN